MIENSIIAIYIIREQFEKFEKLVEAINSPNDRDLRETFCQIMGIKNLAFPHWRSREKIAEANRVWNMSGFEDRYYGAMLAAKFRRARLTCHPLEVQGIIDYCIQRGILRYPQERLRLQLYRSQYSSHKPEKDNGPEKKGKVKWIPQWLKDFFGCAKLIYTPETNMVTGASRPDRDMPRGNTGTTSIIQNGRASDGMPLRPFFPDNSDIDHIEEDGTVWRRVDDDESRI